jgi:hypothetical protein
MRKLQGLQDGELLLLRAEVDAEMRKRALNFNVGEIGEQLAIDYFNRTTILPKLQLAPRGSKNIDAISRDGKRYSIKTVQRGKKTGTIYPDSEKSEEQLFEYLLIVLIDDQYKLQNIYRLTWDMFLVLRAWDKRMSAWYVPVSAIRLQKTEKII